jgi:acetylornithine deacetylase/succinyl-diaminopimelate desuccinylase-like protein
MRKPRSMFSSVFLACSAALSSVSVCAQPMSEGAMQSSFAPADQEAIQLLSDYLKIDTTNPPGNEMQAANFFKAIFDREGIESRIYESAAGRASIVARLKGTGQKKDVVLLNHMDVVPADKAAWKVNPFSGKVQDGYVWGRGAIDMKGMAIVELATMLALKRSGAPLKGDVIFMGTADEEAGGELGAGYIVREHSDLIRNAGMVLNEGNLIIAKPDGAAAYYGVSIMEKTPLWLKLTATGAPSHGSTPAAQTAVTRLVDAVSKIRNWQTPITVVPVVQKFYADIASLAPTPALQQAQRNLSEALKDPQFREEFLQSPFKNALVRNTVAVTMLEGSNKINVIPTRASAQLDVRLLPGEDPDRFIRDLKAVMGEPTIQVEKILSFPSTVSPQDSGFYHVVSQMAATADPGVPVTTQLSAGFTDCHFFREKDIPCYGFMPFKMTLQELSSFHGNNERLSLSNVAFGRKFMHELIMRLATE